MEDYTTPEFTQMKAQQADMEKRAAEARRFKLVFKYPGETVEHEINGARCTAQDLGDALIFALDPEAGQQFRELGRQLADATHRLIVVIPKGTEVWAVEVPAYEPVRADSPASEGP